MQKKYNLFFLALLLSGCKNNESKTFDVVYKNYDGSVLQTINVVKLEDASFTGTNPTKPSTNQYDYVFSGWEKTNDNEYVASFREVAKKYTLAFNSDGGSEVANVMAQYGLKVVDLLENVDYPTKEDFEFNKWTYQDGSEIQASDIVSNDLNFKASWYAIYTITFNDYEGNVLKIYKVKEGEIPHYDGEDPTKPSNEQNDFEFAGWGEIEPSRENKTYNPIFNAVTKKCTITFEGVSIDELKLEYGSNLKEALENVSVPSRENYVFDGFVYANGSTILDDDVVNQNVTIKALWKIVSFETDEY